MILSLADEHARQLALRVLSIGVLFAFEISYYYYYFVGRLPTLLPAGTG